jgi:hypothetical protein
MKTIVKIALGLILLPGVGLFAQDFVGQDFRDALENARAEKAPGTPAPAIVPVPVDFQEDAAAPAAEKEWTIMVFVNGKNNLEGDGLSDINEMEKIGSTPGINVIVEVGQFSSDKMARYYITKDTQPTKITSRLLGSAASIDMGDPASVKDFALWAERRFPAKKYMLILWDHGSGWLKGNPVEAPRGDAKGISDDWITKHNIDTPQLGRLFRDIEAAGGRVDLLAMDACLMQMIEVAYEMKDTKISHIAASEEVEPASGYPYDKWLAPLAMDPAMGAGELGTIVAREYLKANPDGFMGKGLTYSVVEVAKVPQLAAKMDVLAKAAIAAGDKAPVLRARAEATRYTFTDNKDLRRFSQLLMQYSKSADVKAAAAEVERLIGEGGPVLFNGVSVNKPTLSYGIAAYVPENAAGIRGYNELKLSADTSWDEFVNWLLVP